MRALQDLSEREILALAISNEEEDGRILADYAESLRDDYPDTAHLFHEMAVEEDAHRRQLIDTFTSRFGTHIPLVRRQDVRGLVVRREHWRSHVMGVEALRRQAQQMEKDAAAFYRQAAKLSTDTNTRRLLGDLALAEAQHMTTASALTEKWLPDDAREREDATVRRNFVLRIVQPGLVGLMDGSVSTLAPVFAAAFATHNTWNTFLVGLAASIGAGISMGFAEALSDDGRLSGRGTPYMRGLVCGLMTILGGIGHTLPYLLPDFWVATTVAVLVVIVELAAIAVIQWRYMDTPPFSAAAKVMLGGALVLGAGVMIGTS